MLQNAKKVVHLVANGSSILNKISISYVSKAKDTYYCSDRSFRQFVFLLRFQYKVANFEYYSNLFTCFI